MTDRGPQRGDTLQDGLIETVGGSAHLGALGLRIGLVRSEHPIDIGLHLVQQEFCHVLAECPLVVRYELELELLNVLLAQGERDDDLVEVDQAHLAPRKLHQVPPVQSLQCLVLGLQAEDLSLGEASTVLERAMQTVAFARRQRHLVGQVVETTDETGELRRDLCVLAVETVHFPHLLLQRLVRLSQLFLVARRELEVALTFGMELRQEGFAPCLQIRDDGADARLLDDGVIGAQPLEAVLHHVQDRIQVGRAALVPLNALCEMRVPLDHVELHLQRRTLLVRRGLPLLEKFGLFVLESFVDRGQKLDVSHDLLLQPRLIVLVHLVEQRLAPSRHGQIRERRDLRRLVKSTPVMAITSFMLAVPVALKKSFKMRRLFTGDVDQLTRAGDLNDAARAAAEDGCCCWSLLCSDCGPGECPPTDRDAESTAGAAVADRGVMAILSGDRGF
ncbi:BZ3500_MvSof-1268-A1-R1_Chr2-2g05072 [Microbotryum saponariae]|uniref:BZ3500_MvSof-1268-A1-R1_Chr2-2g05072 protein n=1 Tax=Microbotryum saponariae TaxID=289078 RepID=A0A2X0L2Q9_9BASI|nr:BZ3500_MvSof-1268-A1-R1_Chr2-2g05072 [Microbotryum saponariae]SDA00844.1 BZ3501_MvSof-1269-A2-R1_Chr2-2g04746 [Microbotryum saponariae]